ncbi:hypothetical protein CWC19_15565 [Pseudoalteromonas aurantia]|uniref:Uncharacterized protein n=1 Tax=Pseudoalteromonas aurantia TaxID=43654 RepID=A0A5S3V5W8_9GAMM|nr:hypothetical protein CWC19_15565 [Pseudoalteromonas aurantia]
MRISKLGRSLKDITRNKIRGIIRIGKVKDTATVQLVCQGKRYFRRTVKAQKKGCGIRSHFALNIETV